MVAPRFLAILGVVAIAWGFMTASPPCLAQTLTSTVFQTGFTKPVFLTHAPGDTQRVFVVEQTGKIRIIKNGAINATPFLDTASLINSVGLEYGLLMLAFDPNYQTSGVFYTYYTAPTPSNNPVVSRWKVSADPDVADFASRQTVLHIPYNIANHRAGWMDFGPDGYLYISTGDGGENDPQNNASNLAVLKGKFLRLDVNGPDGLPYTADDDGFPADPDRNYHIPADNPFIATPGAAPEIWAYGLRNPWRCSFDRLTNDLWIGDVGQQAREEVDFLPAGSAGAFFGWRCMEGTLPTNLGGCVAPLPPSIPPVYEYPVSAVIGGYVYRGCAIPSLHGKYVFGNWSGWTRSFRYAAPPGAGLTELVDHSATMGWTSGILSSMGEDALGELYLCNWSNGEIRKVVPASFEGPDCNSNQINDACDIAQGTSADANHNGVPDECDPPPACPGDINQSGAVNVDDLLAVINNWSAVGPNPADVTGNGVVNVDDLLAVINAWGPCR